MGHWTRVYGKRSHVFKFSSGTQNRFQIRYKKGLFVQSQVFGC